MMLTAITVLDMAQHLQCVLSLLLLTSLPLLVLLNSTTFNNYINMAQIRDHVNIEWVIIMTGFFESNTSGV